VNPETLVVRKEGNSYFVFDVSTGKVQKHSHLPEGYTGRVVDNLPVKNSLSAPLKLYIDVTNRCNLTCRHCLSSSGMGRGDEISWELLSDIIDWCHDRGVFRIKFGGGEPLVYPHFWDAAKKASEFMAVSTSSNGVLVTPEIASKIRDHKIKISISFDGDEKKHDWLRGPGVYNRAVNALRLLKTAGAKVSMRATMFDSKFYSNLDTVDHLVGIASELDVPLKLIRAKACGRSLENQLGMVNPTKAYFDLAAKVKKLSGVDVEVEGILCSESDESDFMFDNFFDCGAGTRDLRIGPDLVAAPCAFLEEYYLAGKINNVSDMDKIWRYSPALEKLRDVFQNPNEHCSNCHRKWACNGGCRNLALAAGRGDSGVDPCCPMGH